MSGTSPQPPAPSPQASLSGRLVLITSGKGKSDELRRLLEARGARVEEIPLIEIRPLDSPQLDRAVQRITSYHWIAFTSANGVRIFAQKARQCGKWPPQPGKPRLAAVGPGTAAALQQTGAAADLIARIHQAEGLLQDLIREHPQGLEGVRILLPLAALARPLLAEELGKQGAEVDAVPIYDTGTALSSRTSLNRLLRDDPPHLVTLASSSAARALVELCDDPRMPARLSCAAIGPVTAEAARRCGLQVPAVANPSSVPGLVQAIEEWAVAAES